jgi:hypothetical protein
LPTASNLKSHDYRFELITAAGRWQWVTRLDVSLSRPSYSVRDIVTPYGLLRDSIPLPGDVVQAMSESITTLQSNFAPSIVFGPPTTLVFNVTEGRGFSASQSVPVTNGGVYGSLLGVTITSSAPYVRPVPAAVSGLALNETGSFAVDVDSTSLLASSSPYTQTLTLQDPSALNSPRTIPVTINVVPKATVSVSPLTLIFSVTKPLSGTFPPIATQSFSVQNSGPAGSSLDYDVKKLKGTSDWLIGIMPATAVLASTQTQATTLTVDPPDSMLAGTYTETLRVSGYSSNTYVDVLVQLVIT